MNLVFSIIFLFFCTYVTITKNYKTSVILSILSLICDRFFIDFGLNLYFLYIISLTYFFFNLKNFLTFKNEKSISFLINEYLLLFLGGILFGFIFPWQDESGLRSWTQTSQGRSIVTLIRVLGDISIVFFYYDIIRKKKISLEFIINSIAIISCISFWVGFLDYFLNYSIHGIFFNSKYIEKSRFLGLNGEPKALGRSAAFVFSILLGYVIYFKRQKPLIFFALISNFLAVVLSLSSSSIVLFFLLLLINFGIFLLKKPQYLLIILFMMIAFTFVDLEQYQTQYKIEKALFGSEEQWVDNELSWFSRFDIFDRLALIYLYLNPQYLFFGVGPNLISIPASEFIPSSSVFFEEGRVDSVPNVFFINLVARSGFVGLSIYLIGLFKFFNRIKSNPFYKIFFISSLLFAFIYISPAIYLALGVLLALGINSKIKDNAPRISL